jgi:hypothetical protein
LIIFWESVDDREANQNDAYQTIVQKMAPLFVKAPTTNIQKRKKHKSSFSFLPQLPQLPLIPPPLKLRVSPAVSTSVLWVERE